VYLFEKNRFGFSFLIELELAFAGEPFFFLFCLVVFMFVHNLSIENGLRVASIIAVALT
jgi:hypothetical protein